MNNCRFAAIILVASVLAACAIGYQERGSLSDVPGELRGKGYPGNNGGGRFVLNDPGRHLICDGVAHPPTASANPGTVSARAGRGMGCAAPTVASFPCAGRRSVAGHGRQWRRCAGQPAGVSRRTALIEAQRIQHTALRCPSHLAQARTHESSQVISFSWKHPIHSAFASFDYLGKATRFAQEIHEVIDHVSLFEEFSFPEFEALCGYMACYTAPRHGVLIREGDTGDFLVLLLTGKVDVVKQASDGFHEVHCCGRTRRLARGNVPDRWASTLCHLYLDRTGRFCRP